MELIDAKEIYRALPKKGGHSP